MKKYKVTLLWKNTNGLERFILYISAEDIDVATKTILENAVKPAGCFVAHTEGQRKALLSREVVAFDIQEVKDV